MCAEPVTSPDSPDLVLVVTEHHIHGKVRTPPSASFDKLSGDLADSELRCSTCWREERALEELRGNESQRAPYEANLSASNEYYQTNECSLNVVRSLNGIT